MIIMRTSKIDNCPIHGQSIFLLYPHKNNPNNYNCSHCMHDNLNLRIQNNANRIIEIIRVCKKHGKSIFKWCYSNKKTGKGQYKCIECKKEYNNSWKREKRKKLKKC